jgi:chromosome partitioning protein
MDTIVVASQKGGSGKTTTARNLAVAYGPGAALIDTDPQGSLTSWWKRREADTPVLAQLNGDMQTTLAGLKAVGMTLVIIDTPPSAHAFVADVIALADLVLVPVRPTPDDLDAVGPTLDMIEDAGRNFAFVVNAARPKTRLVASTIPALARHGKVSPAVIHERVEFPTAALDGRGVVETGDGPAAAEIRELLAYVQSQLKPRRTRR